MLLMLTGGKKLRSSVTFSDELQSLSDSRWRRRVLVMYTAT